MTDKTLQELAEKLITTYGPSLEKHGKQVISEMREKDPSIYRRLVAIFFGDGGNKDEFTDRMIFDEMLKCYQEYKDRCTQNVVWKYPPVESPEVDVALERVFESQEALREAALQVQSQRGFSALDKRFDRESYMDIIEAPRRALQEANEYLSAVSAWACEKTGCYD